MNENRKEEHAGAAPGAVADAIGGAAVGAPAGLIGSAIGAIAGGALGAKTGHAAVDPGEYHEHFHSRHRTVPCYSTGHAWSDYEPAYQYGYDTLRRYQGGDVDEVEPDLERNWAVARGDSSLDWSDARHALRDGWHHIESRLPGDFDRDGR